MSYGIDVLDNYRRAADYVSQILKGAKVANLPFQEPTRLTLSMPPALLPAPMRSLNSLMAACGTNATSVMSCRLSGDGG